MLLIIEGFNKKDIYVASFDITIATIRLIVVRDFVAECTLTSKRDTIVAIDSAEVFRRAETSLKLISSLYFRIRSMQSLRFLILY